MAYQDDDRITNPDDPYGREWGIGSVITAIAAIVIMAGIVAYEATTNTETGTSSSISHLTTTG
jgi:hypothetical protein